MIASLARYYLLAGTIALGLCMVVRANPALEGYANDAQFTAQVRTLDESDLVQVHSLGKSLGGRDVWLLAIGSGEVDARPAIAVIGNVHGPHLAGAELALRAAAQLVELAKTDEATRKLLSEATFYFVPRPSPEACEKCFVAPFRERAGNDRRTDDDRDFQFGEDPPDDLNGDGWITLMRVADDTGPWMSHPDDPRVLIQADRKKDERGQYRLLVEGKDDDHDEQWNEDGGDGVAFNRNFPFRYEPFVTGSGANAVSEPEHRLLADFLFDRPNIAAVFCFSPEDNLFHPWKPDKQAEGARIKTTVLSADSPALDFLAADYVKLHGGKDAPEAAASRGAFAPWAYFHYGRWPLAARGWWIPKVEPPKPAEGAEEPKPSGEKRGADEINLLRWLSREKLDGFVPWTPVEHPDFPGQKVEVGGFKPFYGLNPPAKELDGLAEKHTRFLTALPGRFAKLAIAEAKAESLGGGVLRISATFVNQGYLPTMPEMGRVNEEPYPLRVELALPPGTEFLQGHPRGQLPRLEGAGGKAERTWLVRVPGELPKGVEIKVFAPAAGEMKATAEVR
ncbi:MAG: M14 family metallopeptidase [Pirellulaceae bacterium]|nr:M14 family metallopeptidase [Pirellulaceae bacterium]